MVPINLTSIMIGMCLRALLGRNSDGLRVDDFASGNGLTDHFSIAAAYNEVACTPVSAEPILSIATCVRMKQVVRASANFLPIRVP